MSHKAAKRFTLLAQHANRLEQPLLRSYQHEMQALAHLDKTLQELQQYRALYHAEFSATQAQNVQQCLRERAFLQQIDRAIIAQQQLQERQHKICEQTQAAWLVKHHACESLKKLSQRYLARAASCDEKQEQRTLDEHSSQRFVHTRNLAIK